MPPPGTAPSALELGPDDVVLGAAPFSHVLGLATGVLSTLLSGSAIAVVRRFEAERTLTLMTETRTTILLGVPTMCIALCQAARSAERAAAGPDRPRRRSRRAGRGRARLRADLRWRGLRGLRPHRALRGRHHLRARPDAQARLGRDAARRHRAADRVARRRAAPARRGRRGALPRPLGDSRLLGGPAGDGRGARRRRLARDRRPRLRGRRRLPVPRRPQEGPDPSRRLLGLPARGRGGALHAPGRARSRRGRDSGRDPRRGGRGADRRRARGPRRRRTSFRHG